MGYGKSIKWPFDMNVPSVFLFGGLIYTCIESSKLALVSAFSVF